MQRFRQLTVLATFIVLALGCGNSEGPRTEQESARQTTEGTKALTEQHYLPVGNLQCPLGGLKIVSGVDQDKSGNLQPEEITTIRYQCTPSVPVGSAQRPADNEPEAGQ